MSTEEKPPKYKRWYDHDPMLVEVLETLRSFKEELRAQSQVFLDKITAEVGQEAVNKFYDKVLEERGDRFGRRWYDQDPVVSKAVELLRVVPPDVQRKAAESFMSGLKAQGIQFPSSSQSK
jgi:hypothetical protein